MDNINSPICAGERLPETVEVPPVAPDDKPAWFWDCEAGSMLL